MMPGYEKDIAKAKQKALDALNARIDEMGKPAYEILLKTIEDTFDFTDGNIEDQKTFIKQLNSLTIDILDLIQTEPKFTGPVSQFVKRTTPTPAFETAKKILIAEIIEKLLNNGLNPHFAPLLRDLIYQNVTNGLSLSDATEQIEKYIEDGKDVSGELDQYIEETAIQAVSAYNRMTSIKMMEEFDFRWNINGWHINRQFFTTMQVC